MFGAGLELVGLVVDAFGVVNASDEAGVGMVLLSATCAQSEPAARALPNTSRHPAAFRPWLRRMQSHNSSKATVWKAGLRLQEVPVDWVDDPDSAVNFAVNIVPSTPLPRLD